MIRKDYLLRYFEELGQVLAKLMGFKEKGDFMGGLELLNETFSSMLHINSGDLNRISSDKLVSYLTDDLQFTLTQVSLVAELLFQEAELYNQLAKQEDANSRYRKVLILYNYINREEKAYSIEREQRSEMIRQLLDNRNLSN
jgi:hypothetical protein